MTKITAEHLAERLASLALGQADAMDLGAPPRDAALLGGTSERDR